ncbi:MAG: haloalkane dehalogenase [Sneathiella sp.]|nr:haloalkane dehalogenase [Sneathiella sp.]
MKYTKEKISVMGKEIAYIEAGDKSKDPVVFLHGNPTSSYLWRNVIPELESTGRCIAPDLLGMGDSEKLPASEGVNRYNFQSHYDYLEATLEALGVTENVTLVIHDWGSALGFHWAQNHKDKVKSIAYMEGIVRPVNWTDWPEAARGIFQGFRSEKGEDLVLKRNAFIEKVLPNSIIRDLSEEEMNAYRAPFTKEEDRQTTLNWPRQIPIDGEPKEIADLVQSYANWLSTDASLPKLFINAEPGSILIGPQREFCRSWPNQKEVTVKGLHFIQEDSPTEIGGAVKEFLADL